MEIGCLRRRSGTQCLNLGGTLRKFHGSSKRLQWESEADNVTIRMIGAYRHPTSKSSASPSTSGICSMQVSNTCFLLASEESLHLRGQPLLLYRSYRGVGVMCRIITEASCQQAGVPLPRSTQHCITPVPNQLQHDLSTLVLYLFGLRRTLATCAFHLCMLKGQGFCSTFALVSEQCPFKTTAPGSSWISHDCAWPVSVLDHSIHFPSTLIKARPPQVSSSPTPAIAFV